MNLLLAGLIGSKEKTGWDFAWKGPLHCMSLQRGASLQKSAGE